MGHRRHKRTRLNRINTHTYFKLFDNKKNLLREIVVVAYIYNKNCIKSATVRHTKIYRRVKGNNKSSWGMISKISLSLQHLWGWRIRAMIRNKNFTAPTNMLSSLVTLRSDRESANLLRRERWGDLGGESLMKVRLSNSAPVERNPEKCFEINLNRSRKYKMRVWNPTRGEPKFFWQKAHTHQTV